jgi:hypothetical protein
MFVFLPLTWLGLRVLGFRKMLEIAHAGTCTTLHPDPEILASAQRKAELTRITANYCLHEGSCLSQSLALCWVLRGKGMDAQIRIGVNKNLSDFSAHAWVELLGQSLDQSLNAYAPVFSSITPQTSSALGDISG